MVHVTIIGLYRYVILVHPRHLGAALTRRYSVVVILVIMYIVPLLLVLIQSFRKLTQTDTDHNGGVVFNRYIMLCSFGRHSEFQHLGIVKKFGVVSLCAAIVGFSYARIYFLVRRRGRRLGGTGGSFNQVRLHRELSLLKTVVGVFLTFAASYLPITLTLDFRKLIIGPCIALDCLFFITVADHPHLRIGHRTYAATRGLFCRRRTYVVVTEYKLGRLRPDERQLRTSLSLPSVCWKDIIGQSSETSDTGLAADHSSVDQTTCEKSQTSHMLSRSAWK